MENICSVCFRCFFTEGIMKVNLGTVVTLCLLFQAEISHAASLQWADAASRDTRYVRELITEHHMAPVAEQNSGFTKRFHDHSEKALTMAKHAENFADYQKVMQFLIAGLADPHTWFLPAFTATEQFWPGFTVKGTRDGLVVDYVSAMAPLKLMPGDRVLSCDNSTPEELLAERVWSFEPNIVSEDARRAEANKLLVSNGDTFYPFLSSCLMERVTTQFQVELQWQRITSHALHQILNDGRESAPLGLHRLSNSVYWVGLPSFTTLQVANEVDDVLHQLSTHSEALKHAEAIVFDLRGNGGQNSGWGLQVLAAIWGEGIYQHLHRTRHLFVEWRLSADNLSALRDKYNLKAKYLGVDHPEAKGLQRLLAGMEDALARKQQVSRIMAYRPNDFVEALPKPIPKLYLLTDSQCSTACLEFADGLLSLPDTTHIGSVTKAGSDYVDTRPVTLPSGNGTLYLTMNRYKGRKRQHGQAYIPHIPYTGDDWSMEAMTLWFRTQVHVF